jgi:hypothetical protein
LLFLLVVEVLSRLIKEANKDRNFKGVNIGGNCHVTHLIFIDDILIFYEGSRRTTEKLKEIFNLFCMAT